MTARTDWRAVDDGTRYFEVGVGSNGQPPDLIWTGMARGRAEARLSALSAAKQAWKVASIIAGEGALLPAALLGTTSCEDAEPELAQGCELRGIVLARFLAARQRRGGPWTAEGIGDIAMAAVSTASTRAMMPPGKTVLFEYGSSHAISGDATSATLIADLTLASGDDLDEGREAGSLHVPAALRGAITAIAVAHVALTDGTEGRNGVSWPQLASMASRHRAALERTADDDATKVALFLGQAELSDEALAFLQAYGRRQRP